VKQSRGEFVLELSDNGEPATSDSNPPTMARLLVDYYAAKHQLALTIQNSAAKGNLIRVSSPDSGAPAL
jgi:hypothetical protein